MTRGTILTVVDNDMTHDARVRRQAETLSRNGWRVIVIARSSGAARVRRLGTVVVVEAGSRPSSSMPLMRIPRALRRKLVLQLAMFRLAGRIRPVAIHAHDIDVLPGSFLAARWYKLPLVYDIHELHAARQEFGILQRPIGWLEGMLARRADAATAPTSMRSSWLHEHYGISPPLVIPNAPRMTGPVPSGRLRDIFDIPRDVPVFLYQGVVNEGRGLHAVLRAMCAIENAMLVILGSGRLVGALQELSRDLGIADRVRFHPAVPVNELPAWTASADIGLQLLENTSENHYTTDSNKIYEYLMAGLPVIASDFPEIRKLVETAGAGLLVNPDDQDAVTAAMKRLVDDTDLRSRLARNASCSRSSISWEAVEHRLVDLFEKVTG